MDLYEIIRELADEKGVTFADISRATGIAETTLSNMKTRNGSLSFANAALIADYFGIPLERLKQDV